MAKAIKSTVAITDEVLLEIPVSEAPVNEYYRRVSKSAIIIQRLTEQQKRGLELLFNGFLAHAATLEAGRFVQSHQDAIKKLLERIDAEHSKE